MNIVSLNANLDAERVGRLFEAAADYVLLEDGTPPSRATVTAFFEDRPPDVPATNLHHIGLEHDGILVGIAGFLFGFPETNDCYIGLMLLAPQFRGFGFGSQAVQHIKTFAHKRGASRLLIAVLDENPKGRAFWESQGFRHSKTFKPSADRHRRHRMQLVL